MSTYTSLYKKYSGFALPACKVTCGGMELRQSTYTINEVVVDNGIGKTAGAARITISNIYNRQTRQLESGALKAMAPGAKVAISLGYGSDVTQVFTGYIDELKTRFSGSEISLTAMCMDARGLMRRGTAYSAAKDKKLPQVIAGILDKYSPLISAKDIKLEAWEQEVNLTQAGGDLDYVCEAALSRGLPFYIDCGKAIIAPIEDKACIELDWEQFGMDLSVRYLDEKLTAYGYDALNMQHFSAEAKVKQGAKQQTLLTVECSHRLPGYMNQDAAKKYVDAYAAGKSLGAVAGTVYCIGLPEVKVGQRVKINKLPLASAGVSDCLAITSVRHRLDGENGFTTEIGIGGDL